MEMGHPTFRMTWIRNFTKLEMRNNHFGFWVFFLLEIFFGQILHGSFNALFFSFLVNSSMASLMFYICFNLIRSTWRFTTHFTMLMQFFSKISHRNNLWILEKFKLLIIYSMFILIQKNIDKILDDVRLRSIFGVWG